MIVSYTKMAFISCNKVRPDFYKGPLKPFQTSLRFEKEVFFSDKIPFTAC